MPKWCVRIAGSLAIAASLLIGFAPAACEASHACPGYAFGQAWIVRGERALAALAILLALLLVLSKLVVEGRLPSRVGREGFEWSESAEGSKEAIAALKQEVDAHSDAIERLSTATAEGLEELARRFDEGER